MSALLSAIGDMFQTAISWVGTVASTIAGTTTVEGVTTFNNPLLLLFCVLPLVGLAIGLFKRLINVN